MTNDRQAQTIDRFAAEGVPVEAGTGALDTTISGAGVAALGRPDTRPLNERCGLCLATMHPQRKTPIGGGEYAHKLCAGLAQPSERVIPTWLGEPIERRRLWLFLAHGYDPVTGGAILSQTVLLDVEEDAAGVPTRLEVGHHPNRMRAAHLPNTAWDYFASRS